MNRLSSERLYSVTHAATNSWAWEKPYFSQIIAPNATASDT